MVDFRKWFLVLALVVMTAATASAQNAAFACTASAGVPPLLRSEGLTELTGDIVLNCTGGDPLVPIIANFQVFLNTNMTSRFISDPYTEAMLLINEPVEGAQVLGTNVFAGRKIGDNSIAWLGVPVVPPGSVGTRVIRMTGVRANANQLGVASGLIPTQVFAFISISGSTSVPLNNPQQTVGFIQSGLEFLVRDTTGGSIDQAERTRLQCKDENDDLAVDPTDPDVDQGVHSRVRFNERFATAFKTGRAVGNQAAPGVIYNTESGYINTSLQGSPPNGTLATFQNGGLANTGTRLRAQFNNIPTGVRLYVTTDPVATTGGSNAVFVTSDPNGVGGSILAPPPPTAEQPPLYIEIPVFNGTGTATWEITAADPLQIGRCDFGVLWAWDANQPGVGTATANGSFAPISSVGTSNLSAPIPRFADTSSAINILELIQCRTSLLFPFVSNQAGFDTGMTIANTSRDSFGTATQTGTCTLNYYGNTNGGAAPPAQTTNAIPAGEHLAATLSGGGNFGVTATPGFQGYIIAVCQFQYAHGFAFISDVGAQRLAQGYVALVINGGQNRDAVRTGSSESLGQ
jgi:hypothetical protein